MEEKELLKNRLLKTVEKNEFYELENKFDLILKDYVIKSPYQKGFLKKVFGKLIKLWGKI